MSMSKNLGQPISDCVNDYTRENIYDRFMEFSSEKKRCMNCPNLTIEDGIVTCKYILEGMINDEN